MKENYFLSLNYTLANEDSNFELSLVNLIRPKNVLSIAGSGARALCLLASDVQKICVLDYSNDQLMLGKFREEAIKQLVHMDYLKLLGYFPFSGNELTVERKEIFKKLNISNDLKSYFLKYLENKNWEGLIYHGKWESVFKKFSKVCRFFIDVEYLKKICNFSNLNEQRNFIKNTFPTFRWKILVGLLGNATVFNSLLYKGSFVKKNVSISHFRYYLNSFSNIFNNTLLRNNFFIQLCFFGKIIYTEGNIPESINSNFEKIKLNLKNKVTVEWISGDALTVIPEDPRISDIDFFSFSNVPSYFEGEREKQYLQIISPKISNGGIVVVRNYLRLPPELNIDGFEDITERYKDLIDKECTQMYMIKIYKKL